MYEPNFMGLDKLPICTMLVGQSNSGKTTILNNLINKKLIWEYEPENIYFFSKTIVGDKAYRPVLRYLAANDKSINIYKFVDFSIIDKIVNEQEQVQIEEMCKIDDDETDHDPMAEDIKLDEPKQYLFVFDDILSDR